MRKTLTAVVASVLLCGCGIVDFDDNINISPNSPSEASAPQLTANAMLSLPGLSSSPQAQFMAQFLAETQYVNASLYPAGGTSFYGWYQGPLINLETVLETATADNQLAVARILKSYYIWNITDRWGDVPYSEALEGVDNFTPAYDPQSEIYDALFDELREAHDQFDESLPINSDIMYGGDHERWKRFANTVRMLMALRLSEVDPGRGETEFNDALNAGVMDSNDDSFVFQHLAEANNQNYWYGEIEVGAREWWALSESLVDLLQPTDDPRLAVYGDEARSTGGYVGLPYGEEEEDPTEDYSLLGEDIRAQDAPVYLVTHPQVLFARAEAAARNWTNEDAEGLYEEAVEQSILQWTGSTDGADALLDDPEVAFDDSRAIELIATQRYIHLFMHGYEAWSEWRRTGYPDNLVAPGGTAVPTRLSYPDNEAFNNTENYEAAVQRQFGGTDDLYGRLWWDAN